MFREAVAAHGRVHTALYTAGVVFDTGPLAQSGAPAFHRVIETEVYGFFHIARVGVPVLCASRGGSFVALTPTATNLILPSDAPSGAPKA